MAFRKGTLKVKKRIMSVCVRLFIQKGYHASTVSQIVKEAQISVSSLQNIFHTKEDILNELIEFMLARQFDAAVDLCGEGASGLQVYAAAAAIQLALAERDENLRDLYLEAYSGLGTSDCICQGVAQRLLDTFGKYQPGYTLGNFYNMELGISGIMRGYMSRKCSMHFTFEEKLEYFLAISLRAYQVPEEELAEVLQYIKKLDMLSAVDQIWGKILAALEEEYDFKL